MHIRVRPTLIVRAFAGLGSVGMEAHVRTLTLDATYLVIRLYIRSQYNRTVSKLADTGFAGCLFGSSCETRSWRGNLTRSYQNPLFFRVPKQGVVQKQPHPSSMDLPSGIPSCKLAVGLEVGILTRALSDCQDSNQDQALSSRPEYREARFANCPEHESLMFYRCCLGNMQELRRFVASIAHLNSVANVRRKDRRVLSVKVCQMQSRSGSDVAQGRDDLSMEVLLDAMQTLDA